MSKVEVDLANERAVVEYDPILVKIDSIEKAIEEVWYRVVYERVILGVEGITDSSDAQRLEQSISQMEGIRSASINYGSSQISVEYNPALVSLADVRKKIANSGYTVQSETAQTSAQAEKPVLYRACLHNSGSTFQLPRSVQICPACRD